MFELWQPAAATRYRSRDRDWPSSHGSSLGAVKRNTFAGSEGQYVVYKFGVTINEEVLSCEVKEVQISNEELRNFQKKEQNKETRSWLDIMIKDPISPMTIDIYFT